MLSTMLLFLITHTQQQHLMYFLNKHIMNPILHAFALHYYQSPLSLFKSLCHLNNLKDAVIT